MTAKTIFAVASVAIGLVGFIPYLKDTLAGRTKPHVFTYLIWMLTQGTAAFGAWKGGGGWGTANLVMGTALVTVIFFLALRDGPRDITKSDVVVLAAAIVAALVWWGTQDAALAVILAAAIDLAGYIPTFRKCYRQPWSETGVTWVLATVSFSLAVLALDQYNALTLGYLLPVLAINVAFLIYLLARRRVVPQPRVA